MWLHALLRRISSWWQPQYEPSRHYMRGPGPAAAAKRGSAPPMSDTEA
jgi:hypothetical protein